jgi:hypothetical protein
MLESNTPTYKSIINLYLAGSSYSEIVSHLESDDIFLSAEVALTVILAWQADVGLSY